MSYRIPLAYNIMGDAELGAAKDVLDSGLVTQGRRVAAFEKEIATYHGVRHAIFVNSGSTWCWVGSSGVTRSSYRG